MAPTTTFIPSNWNITQKIAFRFFFVFFVIYIILEPNGVVPLSDWLSAYYMPPFHALIPWLAKKCFAYVPAGGY